MSDQRRKRLAWGLLASTGLVLSGWLAGCAADDDATGIEDGSFGPGQGFGDGNVDVGDGDGDATVGGVGFGGENGGIPDLPPLPEEVEDDSDFRAPVATGKYLWSANPESGRVALINVEDLTTQVLPAGLFPTFLTSVGTEESPAALVLNVGSSDATRFRVRNNGNVLRDTVGLHVGANRWSTSPSGDWAVAWSRPENGTVLDPTEGLQEISVVALGDEMESTRLTVGYRPSQVHVSSDDKRLIVVSEEGITLIDLTETPAPYDWIDLGFDADNRDVSINEDGTFAVVRRSEESTVDVINLLNPEEIVELNFSANVTDVDLANSGRAVAVIRARSELSTFTIDEVLEDPSDIDTVNIPEEVFGSVTLTEDGKTAVLYTNALLNEKVNIVDLRPSGFLEFRSLNTQAPVFNVTTTPDGKHAVVLAARDDLQLGDQGRPAEAFSVIALRSERFPRVVGTGAPVLNVALGNEHGIITASSESDQVHESYLVELPGLSVTKERLATTPLAAGVLEDLNLAYAAQAHPEGRVTFFDFIDDEARTLTGFELSAEVVDE